MAAATRTANLARQRQQGPNRVNPGTVDMANPTRAPRVQIDKGRLASNPDPNRFEGSGFAPPPGWLEQQREELEDGIGPGGRPPQ